MKKIRKRNYASSICLCVGVVLLVVLLVNVWVRYEEDIIDWMYYSSAVNATGPIEQAYVVRANDTLWRIAQRHIDSGEYEGFDIRDVIGAIRKKNPHVDPGALQIGSRILLPTVEEVKGRWKEH